MNRREVHAAVSGSLASLSDEALSARIDGAERLHAGIGGTSVRLTVEGAPVFVKRLPLTDRERRPPHVHSTANVFGLPTCCQYGVGGCPGFGAWRELAAHEMASRWVLDGEHVNFPVLYHVRVLPSPRAGPMDAEQRECLERDVLSWEGSPAVRARLEAVHDASAHVVLFTEFIPRNLLEWMTDRFLQGADAAAQAIALVEGQLWATNAFMNARGLVHFDVHFENILTDGCLLYFGDFGLASSPTFELSPEERRFLEGHRTYDDGRAAVGFLHCLAASFLGKDDWRARAREYVESGRPSLPPPVASAIHRVAPAALRFLEFSQALQRVSKRTPYPDEEMGRLLVRG